MSSAENVLRAAAFGARDVPEPVGERVLAAAAHRAGVPALERWLAAVVLGARGRYAAATTVLEPLTRHGEPVVASLAATALASQRRQLGGHAVALALDGLGLRRALDGLDSRWDDPPDRDGLDARGALADALTGLAADRVGMGRTAEADALLARAARVVAVTDCPRSAVRLDWVRAECALASGRAGDSISPAKRAWVRARDGAGVRHQAKSGLVLGAALAASGEDGKRKRAAEIVGEALATARRHGWRSLTWPAQLLLADLHPECAVWNHSRVTEELTELLRSTDPVGRRLARTSPWVPI
ncbi:hypothetical protein [Saccharomonospora piscinae]|uniref:hypothetical protein n=1 Tax=Saccharomonospora piscinae TaxID=687388 RepID=UPI000464574F|nr:hypothetical protein [Saccharomonospora piscinae]